MDMEFNAQALSRSALRGNILHLMPLQIGSPDQVTLRLENAGQIIAEYEQLGAADITTGRPLYQATAYLPGGPAEEWECSMSHDGVESEEAQLFWRQKEDNTYDIAIVLAGSNVRETRDLHAIGEAVTGQPHRQTDLIEQAFLRERVLPILRQLRDQNNLGEILVYGFSLGASSTLRTASLLLEEGFDLQPHHTMIVDAFRMDTEWLLLESTHPHLIPLLRETVTVLDREPGTFASNQDIGGPVLPSHRYLLPSDIELRLLELACEMECHTDSPEKSITAALESLADSHQRWKWPSRALTPFYHLAVQFYDVLHRKTAEETGTVPPAIDPTHIRMALLFFEQSFLEHASLGMTKELFRDLDAGELRIRPTSEPRPSLAETYERFLERHAEVFHCYGTDSGNPSLQRLLGDISAESERFDTGVTLDVPFFVNRALAMYVRVMEGLERGQDFPGELRERLSPPHLLAAGASITAAALVVSRLLQREPGPEERSLGR